MTLPGRAEAVPDQHLDLAELRRLGDGGQLPGSQVVPVPGYVAEFARTQPSLVAVRCQDQTLRYGELHVRAGEIAARLLAAGVRPGDRVGLLGPPSTTVIAAVVGILRAGAAYVPVDPAQPDQRIRAVFADAKVSCVVTTADAGSRLADSGLSVMVADRPSNVDDVDDLAVEPAIGLDDPAYLIYTSGSTGEPKGVLVRHRQLAASTAARRAVYPGAAVFLLVSPLAFDSSVAGLWGTLTTGGRLVVATPDEVRDPERLLDLVHREGVTRLLCVPSLYSVLLDAAERAGADRLGTLDTVIVAGEPLPEALVRRHFALHTGNTCLVNEYGPTETTVWASYRRFGAPAAVSIGRPVPGTRLYVLDDQLRPVPRGAEGELCIAGDGVSAGYFNRPGATARVFVPDPFAGGRMYRTGDRARWNDDDMLEFLGRRDHQVKIRGHRVELGAVEAALRGLDGVGDAVVVPNSAGTQLIGFVRLTGEMTGDSLRERLSGALPETMVPARIQVLDSFPTTFTGKVDRARLRVTADQAPAGASTGQDVTGVAAAWAEVLKLPDVPVNVNFFDLGGHSLTMFELQDALERHTGTRPSVVALFQYTTVSAQARLIRSGGGLDSARTDRRQAAVKRLASRARRQQVNQESVT